MADVQITINGRAASVRAGISILEAAKQMGIEIPHFCYHPGLTVVGVCRMCLVQVKGAPKLVIACNTPVSDGMVIETKSTEVIGAQNGMIEFLLLDHPLDCPICDKGGECPLQDFTQRYGPKGSRLDLPKQTTYKRRPLGPHILFDEERCILCWRCTRYSEEITGYSELGLVRRGSRTQIDLMHGDELADPFQGNLADICPVGALTSRQFRFQARPWEMRRKKTTCQICPVGCSMEAWSLKGRLVRITAAENLTVNDYWICDRGRYGHEYQNGPGRVTQPLVRRVGELVATSWQEALGTAAEELRERGPAAIVAGDDLTNEDYFALQRLARETLGTSDMDLIEPAPAADLYADLFAGGPVWGSSSDLETAGAILIVGEDLERTHPVLFLRLRKAMRRGVPVAYLGSERSRLERLGATTELCEPAELAGRLAAFAAARKAGLRAAVGAQTSALAERLAGHEPLKLVVNAPSRAAELLAAARAACAPEAGRAGIQVLQRGANAQGARDVGFASAFLPGYRRAPAAGRNLEAIARAAQAGEIGTVLLVGLDKPRGGNGATPAPSIDFGRARRVVFASFLGPACEAADVVLPAQTPLESSGTRTNPDRRVLPVCRTMPPAGVAQPVWALAQALSNVLGKAWNHASDADVFAAIRNEAAPYRALGEIAPGGKAWDITSLRTA